MVYIGVDLHRKRSQLGALDADGAQRFSRSIPTRPHEFLRVFGELEPEPIDVAFEATVGWGWFADLLGDAGVPGHMAHPLATRAIATAWVKNDTLDARTLAHLLRTHLLPEAWIAPPEVRQVRRLVRMRVSLVRERRSWAASRNRWWAPTEPASAPTSVSCLVRRRPVAS